MEPVSLFALLAAAFFAGFVDAVAGGGGLIQVPALLGALPQTATATVFGTNKLSSIFGTASATWRYLHRVAVPWKIVTPAAFAAFWFSFIGAASVAWFPAGIVRPVVLALLVAVIVYTVWQPQVGLREAEGWVPAERKLAGALVLGAALGFYDGFFGPGTGSFLIFLLVQGFGLDFLRASAGAKVVNLATNAAALCFFVPSGFVLFEVGLAMAVANVAGAQVGARSALRGGSVLVRRVFLAVASLLVCKVAWDLFRLA